MRWSSWRRTGASRTDRRRDRLGRHPARRLRGQVPRRGRLQPGRHRGGGHRRRRGQPRDLPDGEAPLRCAADDRQGQQPEERVAVQAPRRRRDHQPDPDDPRVDRAGHPGPRAAPPRRARRGRARADRGPPPARLAGDRPGRPRTSRSRRAARCSPSSATASRRRSGPRPCSHEGDKVIAIGRTECEALLHEQLIGDVGRRGRRLTVLARPAGSRADEPPLHSNSLDNGIVRVL